MPATTSQGSVPSQMSARYPSPAPARIDETKEPPWSQPSLGADEIRLVGDAGFTGVGCGL